LSQDVWDDGSAYDRYIGRWSGVIASAFLRWLGLPGGGAWLDFGCGTGALARRVLAECEPRLVVGCDRSPGFVAFARDSAPDPRADFAVAELPDLPRTEGGFDAAVSGLVLNFLPSPLDGATAMAARTRRGGAVAAYVWDYAEGMQALHIFWEAAKSLDPAAVSLDESARFPLCQPEPMRELLERAGLGNVAVRALEIPTVFKDFDDYWAPFLGGQGPAPSYVMSLPARRREALRELTRSRLPVGADGTIRLTARAWAARGTVV